MPHFRGTPRHNAYPCLTLLIACLTVPHRASQPFSLIFIIIYSFFTINSLFSNGMKFGKSFLNPFFEARGHGGTGFRVRYLHSFFFFPSINPSVLQSFKTKQPGTPIPSRSFGLSPSLITLFLFSSPNTKLPPPLLFVILVPI